MALIAGKQNTNSGVSDLGEARRSKRQKEAMQKVSSKLADSILRGTMLTESSTSVVSGLAKSRKPAAKVETPKQPAPQPVSKVKKVPKPKPVKAKAEKATTRKYKRTNRVAELIAMPEHSLRTVPPAKYTDRAYVESQEQSLRITAIERKTHELARKVLHDRYLNSQDEREILTMVHDGRAASCKKGKRKELVRRVRSNSMYNTLERLATFESVCHLTDDHNQYEGRHIVTKNNITVGGVRFTLGYKLEEVWVPCTGTAKAEKRAGLARIDSVKSRSPKGEASAKQPVVKAEELEDLPPWPMTAGDAVARGYGSLEQEFDAPYKYEYDPFEYKHIPMGMNVQDIMNAQAARRMSHEEQFVFGMLQRDRDALRIKGQQDRMWREQAHHALPAVRMRRLTMDAFASPATGNPQYSTNINEQLKTEFSKQVDTKVAAKVAYYRERFSWAVDKKAFLKEEELRIEQHRMEMMGNSHLQANLERKEQTYQSDPRGEEERYQKWLFMNTETCWEDYQYHLANMHYTEIFGGERVQMQCSESVSYKPLPIPKHMSLSRPVDNIYLDLPPTGVAPVTLGPVNVSQNQPDFLSDGDVVVPFTGGTNTAAGVPVPSKGLMLLNSAGSWFELGSMMPSTS
jgi:hypothetical protein